MNGVKAMDNGIPERFLEPLEDMARKVKEELDAHAATDQALVQKGLILYRQGLVKQIRYESHSITAAVLDVNRVQVSLNIEDYHISRCSCPAEGTCRHMMAVFFYLLAKNNSVSNWIESWRAPIKERKTLADLGLKRARDLMQTNPTKQPDYDNWIRTFTENFQQIMYQSGQYPKPYVVSDLFYIYLRKINAYAPIKKEWKLLYQLIGSMHTFMLLEQFATECKHSEKEIERHYLHLFQDLMEESSVMMERLSQQTVPFAFDPFIERLRNEATALIDHRSEIVQFERIQLYRRLWTQFFKQKSWREEELEKLRTLYETDTSLSCTIGMAHLHFLLHDDQKVFQLIDEGDYDYTPYFFYWIYQLNAQKEWKRAEQYIETLLPYAIKYLEEEDDFHKCSDLVKMVLEVITPYCQQTKRNDLYEKVLTETLPYSFYYYDDFLYEYEQWEKWVDLQALLSIRLTDISQERLERLEKAEPTLLLPLYHQAIQHDIHLKSREQYRQAVKKMQKLRSLYEKLSLASEWEQFLEELLESTKRLRAFQEECKRGKLIHA